MVDLVTGATAGHAETGRTYLDGETLVGALDGVIRARLKMARGGHVLVSVCVDEVGDLFADPQVTCEGAPVTLAAMLRWRS